MLDKKCSEGLIKKYYHNQACSSRNAEIAISDVIHYLIKRTDATRIMVQRQWIKSAAKIYCASDSREQENLQKAFRGAKLKTYCIRGTFEKSDDFHGLMHRWKTVSLQRHRAL